MAVLAIHEHARVQVGPEFIATADRPMITQQQFDQIARLNDYLRRKGHPEPFELAHRSIKAKQYVGVVSFGAHSLEVLPKIDSIDTEDERTHLLTMLSQTRKLRLTKGTRASIGSHRSSFIEYFFREFLLELQHKTQCGLISRYQSKNDILPTLKGKFLASIQVRSGFAQANRFHCEYDEFSINNAYNQFIRYVLRLIQPHLQVAKNQVLAKQLLWRLDGVSDCIIPPNSKLSHLSMDRSLSEYDLLLSMAKLFFKRFSPGVVSGNQKLFSTFFDMNRLFEEYFALSLKFLAPQRVFVQQPERYLAIDKDGKPHFKMRPDVLIQGKDGAFDTVVDTKWKRLSRSEPNYGISHSDVYQLLAYARQYGCKKIALVYPASSDITGYVGNFKVRDAHEQIKIFGLNVRGLDQIADQLRSFDLLSLG